jgi:hypothetical protein
MAHLLEILSSPRTSIGAMDRLCLCVSLSTFVAITISACHEPSSAQAQPARPARATTTAAERPTAEPREEPSANRVEPEAASEAASADDPPKAGVAPATRGSTTDDPPKAGVAPATRGWTADPPPRRSGAIVRSSDYRTSCTSDSECVTISEGDVCGPCHCASGAINRVDLGKYRAFVATHLPSCPKGLVCVADCEFVSGTPGLCVDHVCRVPTKLR